MSTNEKTIAALKKAQSEVERLCSAGERWRMSIPANEQRDSDLIISTAITMALASLESQPVACQVRCPDDLRDAVNNDDTFQWIVYDMDLLPEQISTLEQVCALRAAWMMYQAMLERPNANQPHVPFVVSLDAIADVINEDSDIEEVYPLAKAIHALITSREVRPVMKEKIRFAWAFRNLGRVIRKSLGIPRVVGWLSKVIKKGLR